jgi:hypothetical protein
MGAVFGPPIAAIIGVFQWLGGIVGSIVGGIWGGITSAFGAVTGFLGGVGSTIGKLFAGAGSWLFGAGKDIISGLINGASSLLSTIGQMFLNIIPDWIKVPFKKALGINSPSTVFAGFGSNITQGLANGINNGQGMVSGAVSNITGAVLAPLTSPAVAVSAAGANATPGAGQVAGGTGIVQNNNIFNQVDLNTVTRELAWQVRH